MLKLKDADFLLKPTLMNVIQQIKVAGELLVLERMAEIPTLKRLQLSLQKAVKMRKNVLLKLEKNRTNTSRKS